MYNLFIFDFQQKHMNYLIITPIEAERLLPLFSAKKGGLSW